MRKSLFIMLLGLTLIPAVARASEWYEKIKFKADFRHRHELIQLEENEDRTRWRLRLRLSLTGNITDDWSVHARFATGSSDPLSTNQTMDGGFSTKGLNLDRAYFDFHPQAIKGLNIIGGKIKLPFIRMEKTELIWDGDLNPEGAAAMYNRKATNEIAIMLNTAFLYIEERKSDDDTWMAGIQGAVKANPNEELHFIAGGGYFDYENVKGMKGIYDAEKFAGNTHVATSTGDDTFQVYDRDYNLAEAFGEIGFKREQVSVKVYGNFVNNIDADSLGVGWLAGSTFKYGKNKGHVKLYANWRELEENAVIGASTDSDFIGGGTNGKGLEVGMGYGITKNVDFAVTYFFNKQGIEEEGDYKRLQVDLKAKF
ncbi:MAG: putative porin [Candidatus Hydrogenedentota bacterium]|nr:MAG: putative porin [Candidatus Hydrogenedentota bacterium]